MRISSPRLRRLDNALAALPAESDAMLISELDGYLAGVIVCPASILPGEWLPLVWGPAEDAPPFADAREAQWYAALVMEHHDAIVRTLGRGRGRYAPFLEVDPRHDEVLWELWVGGFETAMNLRPDAWGKLADSGDEGAAAALAGMITLTRIAQDESDLERETIDALTEEAPDLIPGWIETLDSWRRTHDASLAPSAEMPRPHKPGRNDPCPCGSGRKYKKCCGN